MKWIFACVAIAAALLVSDVELGRISRRKKPTPSVEDRLAAVFGDDFLCAPPNRAVEVQQGETEVDFGTTVPPSDLTEPPTIAVNTDDADDCSLFTVIIVCAYESSLNQTSEETSEENSEEESGNDEEDCEHYPVEESEEESKETEEEEVPEYGYASETLVFCPNLDSNLDLSDCELPYRPPTLIPGAGTKQCIVVVYPQDKEIDAEQVADLCRTDNAPCDIRDQFELPDPYAANFFSIADVAEATEDCYEHY